MDYTKATDTQLETISRYDLDCSPSLLKGVIEEMLNRNLFDRVIVECFKKTIGNIEWMKDVYKLDMEDFLQIGRMQIFKSVERFEEGKGMSFTSFVFLRVQQEFIITGEFLSRKKRDVFSDISYNVETDDGEELLNAFPIATNVEKYVINKITIEELLDVATDKQREIIELKLKDYTNKEIGAILGVTRQSVEKMLKRVIERYWRSVSI